jgi:hypothetical protein
MARQTSGVQGLLSSWFINLICRYLTGLLGWGIGRSEGVSVHRATQAQNKYELTVM